MILKKGVLLLLVFLGICLPLMAGGQSESETVKDNGPVTLTVWDFKYSEEVVGSALKDMDSLYMSNNPGIEIKHIAQPHDSYYEILTSSLSSGVGPDVLMAHADQRIWNLDEFLLPLDSYIASWKDDIADSAWTACSSTKESDKNIKIIPLTAQGLGIYFNKSNLSKAGVDLNADFSDWNTFLDTCEKLKATGIPPIVMGNGGAPYSIDFMYRTLLANFYGPELTGFSNGKANFTDEAFIEATRMIKTLFTKGYVMTENATMPYFMDAIQVFKNGEGGFFIGLTSDIAHWKDFGDAFGYENLGYIPSINSAKAKYKNRQSNQGAGIGFAVQKSSKHKEESVKYLYGLIHGESANIFLNRTGAIIPNKNLPIENKALATVVGFMNKNAVPDFYNQLDAGFAAEFYNYIQLFFLADEMTLNEYIDSLQKSYKSNL